MTTGGFSPDRLARLETVLTNHVESGQVAGAIGLIDRRGETHIVTAGKLRFDGDAPMQHDTIFRIASMTKPVVAVAAMMLVEECRIRLDDPVDAILPELANRQVLRDISSNVDDTVPANRPITTRDLLAFTMGMGVVPAMPGTYPIQTAISDLGLIPGISQLPEPDEYMRRQGTLPLLHQPGAHWMYGTGSAVLGVLISRLSGQSLGAFLQERLFAPLGMKDTGFSVPAEHIARLATSYRKDWVSGDIVLNDPAEGGQWATPPTFESGAAGLVSTVDDYHAFARMLRQHGTHNGVNVLSPASVELMTTDQLTPAQKQHGGLYPGFFDELGWGFGLAVTTRRTDLHTTPGSYGWFGALGTSWQNDPKEGLIGILMTQTSFNSPEPPVVDRDFWTTTYQAIAD